MKKLTALILLLALLPGLSGCSGRRFYSRELLESEYGEDLDCPVELRVSGEVNSLTPSLPLSFDNGSSQELSYGSLRRLEVRLRGRWYIVPDLSPAVSMGLSLLPAGESGHCALPLQGHYGSLPRGSYRVIKEFYTESGLTLAAAAEFKVK